MAEDGIIEAYTRDLALFGDDSRAVHYKSEQEQFSRFSAAARIAELDTASILDIGCGKADFLAYLRSRGCRGDYTGCDLTPAMIERCAKRFPDARFVRMDAHEELPDGEFDYGFIIGMLNDRIPDAIPRARELIRRAYLRCRKALMFNILSTFVDFQDPLLTYADPAEMFLFCRTELSRWVTLRHDYSPFEFMMYVYREGTGAPLRV